MRIGLFSTRDIERHLYRCPGYEFEDLIAENFGATSFVAPAPQVVRHPAIRAKRWLLRRSTRLGGVDFGAPGMTLDAEFDLFFAAPALPADLMMLSTVRNWRRQSKKAVCFLQELWLSEMKSQLPRVIGVLNQFDHVFCGLYHTAEALKSVLSVPVEYMPLGVDAEMFYPWHRSDKSRVIDVCAIGNMDPDTHQALWDWAEESGRFYHHTAVAAANFSGSHKLHRRNLAQTLQRSKVFFTYLAKRVVTGQRAAQEEFGPRYFEGAAAGALQVGDTVTSNPAYRDYVNWDGAVIEVPYSSKDMPALLEEIEKDASWVAAQRKANVIACLLGHDHLYRWDRVMAAAGLAETPGMAARRVRLNGLAAALNDQPRSAGGGGMV